MFICRQTVEKASKNVKISRAEETKHMSGEKHSANIFVRARTASTRRGHSAARKQVILVKNLSTGRGMANGSRAVVVRFATLSGARLPVLRFTSGLEDVIRSWSRINIYCTVVQFTLC